MARFRFGPGAASSTRRCGFDDMSHCKLTFEFWMPENRPFYFPLTICIRPERKTLHVFSTTLEAILWHGLTGIGEHLIANLIISRGDLVSFIEVDHCAHRTEATGNTNVPRNGSDSSEQVGRSSDIAQTTNRVLHRTSNRTAPQFVKVRV